MNATQKLIEATPKHVHVENRRLLKSAELWLNVRTSTGLAVLTASLVDHLNACGISATVRGYGAHGASIDLPMGTKTLKGAGIRDHVTLQDGYNDRPPCISLRMNGLVIPESRAVEFLQRVLAVEAEFNAQSPRPNSTVLLGKWLTSRAAVS